MKLADNYVICHTVMGERLLHTQEVGSSSLSAPTISKGFERPIGRSNADRPPVFDPKTDNLGRDLAGEPPSAVTIQLTKGFVALIDAEDEARVRAFNWHANVKETGVYAQRFARKGENRYLHHFVMDRKPGEWYDHESGQTLDCTKLNLRRCSRDQNNQNRVVSSLSVTGYKGVEERESGFGAYIYVGKHRRRLGTFATPELAASRYNIEAILLYGEFARLNVVPPDLESLLALSEAINTSASSENPGQDQGGALDSVVLSSEGR